MAKEDEAREAADKARMREIDARLRDLASSDAADAADAGDAENDAQVKAPPDEIRKLVRMYSALRVPPPLV